MQTTMNADQNDRAHSKREYLAFALKGDGSVLAIGETSSGFTLKQQAP